jgi:hypothetical protein
MYGQRFPTTVCMYDLHIFRYAERVAKAERQFDASGSGSGDDDDDGDGSGSGSAQARADRRLLARLDAGLHELRRLSMLLGLASSRASGTDNNTNTNTNTNSNNSGSGSNNSSANSGSGNSSGSGLARRLAVALAAEGVSVATSVKPVLAELLNETEEGLRDPIREALGA